MISIRKKIVIKLSCFLNNFKKTIMFLVHNCWDKFCGLNKQPPNDQAHSPSQRMAGKGGTLISCTASLSVCQLPSTAQSDTALGHICLLSATACMDSGVAVLGISHCST